MISKGSSAAPEKPMVKMVRVDVGAFRKRSAYKHKDVIQQAHISPCIV
jgi:hypothetical protein